MPEGMLWHRRLAIQIAAQLPDEPDDALEVLAYAEELVERFIRRDVKLVQEAVVLPFSGPSSALCK